MAHIVTGKDAAQIGKRASYIHGALRPIQEIYYEWADDLLENGKPVLDTNGKKMKVPGTGGEREREQWLKLPEKKQGRKWVFTIDPRVLKPDLAFDAVRGEMLGFERWNVTTVPSIMDTVGMKEDSLTIFAERALEDTWFVEAERVFTGYYNDKPQDTFKFTRMTQDINELRQWNNEKYPSKEVVVPDDFMTQAELYYRKMAKVPAAVLTGEAEKIQAAKDKFYTYVQTSEELSPYFAQIVEASKSW